MVMTVSTKQTKGSRVELEGSDRISFSRNPISTSSHPLQLFAPGSRVARSLTCLTVFSVYDEEMLCVGVAV